MEELFSFFNIASLFLGEHFYLFAIPFGIGIAMILFYPFSGETGTGLIFGYMFIGVLPVYLYMKLDPLIDMSENNIFSIIPLVWLGLNWIVCLVIKLEEEKKEKEAEQQQNKKSEASKIVNKLRVKK